MGRLIDSGLLLPKEVEDARILTPFATEFRYEEFLPNRDAKALDRARVLGFVEHTREWAESSLRKDD